MGIKDQVFNNVSVPSGGSNSSSQSSSSGSGFPGSAENNAIQKVGGHPLDKAFLDALYTGGKLTSAQRDAILGGSDPSGYGLSPYDLNVLTVGRLGSRNAASSVLPVIVAFALGVSYQPGQLVFYQPPGAPAVGVYQALTNPPAGTLPTSAAHWQAVVAPTIAPIVTYQPTLEYQPGAIVLYQPPSARTIGLYQATQKTPAGTLPTSTTYWTQILSAGATVLLDQDVLNPAMALLAAVATITGAQTTSGTAMPAIIIPAGRRYRVRTEDIRPVAAGTSTPADAVVRLFAHCVESPVGNVGDVSLVITPKWQQIATAVNAPIAAQGANTLAARIVVDLL